jgi:hypothetical protein
MMSLPADALTQSINKQGVERLDSGVGLWLENKKIPNIGGGRSGGKRREVGGGKGGRRWQINSCRIHALLVQSALVFWQTLGCSGIRAITSRLGCVEEWPVEGKSAGPRLRGGLRPDHDLCSLSSIGKERGGRVTE